MSSTPLRTVLLALVAVIAAVSLFLFISETLMAEPTPRADRLFGEGTSTFDARTYEIAQEIERGVRPSEGALERLGKGIDDRHGNGITLLFHAVNSANLEAVDALLAAGADPHITDKPEGSSRSFVYYLTLPGGPLMGEDGINAMLSSYLRHGGDPNATFGDPAKSQGNLPYGVALGSNHDGFRLVLNAGGDPWLWTYSNREVDMTPMMALADDYNFLEELIDEGHFDNRSQAEISRFLGMLSAYSQRGDERSRKIQRVAKRILKRNPNFTETTALDSATSYIFKNHWKDSKPGVIPWDEIRSDAVD